MKRNSRGQFQKKSGSHKRHHKARASRRRHSVHGYTQHRGKRTVHVRKHVSREPAAPRRRRGRRSARRGRMTRGRRGGARPVIVVANASRRRHTRRAKEPPMFTFGGMAVFGLGGLFGYQIADVAARYYEGYNPASFSTAQGGTNTGTTTGTTAAQLPSGMTTVQAANEVVQAVSPTLMRSVIELAISAAGFVVGAVAPWPLVKLAGYGWGFGALFHWSGAMITGYILRPMFVTAATTTGGQPSLSPTGQILYQHEQTAENARATAAGTSGGTALGAPPPNRAGTKVSTLGAPAPRAGSAARPVVLSALPPGASNPLQRFGGAQPTSMTPGGNPSSFTPAQPAQPAGGGGGGGAPPAGGGGGGGDTPPMNTAPPPGSSTVPTGAGPTAPPASTVCPPAPCGDPAVDDDNTPHPLMASRLRAIATHQNYPRTRAA